MNFDQYLSTARSSLPGTPQDLTYSSTPHNNDELTPPSDLCRWYIHVRQNDYEPIPSDKFERQIFLQSDPDEDSTWTTWSSNEQQASLQAHLRNALEHNDFSTTPTTELPVAIPQIAKAADEERSNELLVESLGFSIMSRNSDQIRRILRQLDAKKINPASLGPFHLAASFLDGSKSCCNVFSDLTSTITGAKVHEMYWNEHGHTVLDSLMIAIIKSHTSARPVVVDDNLKDVARFVGEEMDICGRWDADSPCLRQLYAHGRTSIPSNWKHKFCNTSIQAIYHCIDVMVDNVPNRLLYETPSGLYTRRCFSTDCGKRLQLQPLHSLVMTAYHLATHGMKDEDLFGILAFALCLISSGLDPSVKADVSVAALLSLDSIVECDHEELTAAGLAQEILYSSAFRSWNTKLKTGWIVLVGVLRRCEAAHIEQVGKEDHSSKSSGDEYFMGCTEPDERLEQAHINVKIYSPCFQGRAYLGTLWSSVQAEFLSYRRLNEGLGWTSQYFLMETLQEQLEKDDDLMVGYAEQDLLKAHCACHSFGSYRTTVLSQAIDPHLANLDIWGRATYGAIDEDM